MKTWQKIKQNPQLLRTFLMREKVIDAIRDFLKNSGFREVETPLMVAKPGTEPYLEVFPTTLKTRNHPDKPAFLLTSPEYSMKKLLTAGLGSIFTICKSFRNDEGLSPHHNPEFTILEFYRVNGDYQDVMRDCENMLLHILRAVGSEAGASSSTSLFFQNKTYDLSAPWERISVAQAFKKFADIDMDDMLSPTKLPIIVRQLGLTTDPNCSWEEAYNLVFLNKIEPNIGLIKPTIIYDYPASQAALSKKNPDDPRFAQRFEFYLAGMELGNAFSELTDAQEQESRLTSEVVERKKLGKVEYGIDEDFIQALKEGMPRAGGIAIGVDRLVMLFANAASIKDTIFFPVDDVFEYDDKT
jgi:elongation factor P--(R)-beta-lysine ligase